MATKENRDDAGLAAFGAIPQGTGWYHLSVTTTSASIASLPAGRYIATLDGVTTVAISSTGAVTEPASGSAVAVSSTVVQTGWQYKHPADGACHIVVLNAGSGRVYLVPAP